MTTENSTGLTDEALAKLIADLHVWADAADEGDRIAYAYANGAPCPDIISQMGADIRKACALLSELTLLRQQLETTERERDEAREKVASWMTSHSFATGHGDTLDDLLSELSWQVREREQARLSGLAEAAAWHDKRAHETPDVFEREFHEVSRNAFLKALSPPPIASSEEMVERKR